MTKTEKFIQKIKKVHGDKYAYNRVKYLNAKTKIKVICKEHGIFEVAPYNHLNGSNCPKCSLRERRDRLSFTKEDFIREAKQKHGDKYDYSKTVYVRNKDKVTITCPVHGDFLQTPALHKKGSGCMKCHKDSILVTVQDFIERSNKLHNNKFDYLKIDFKHTKDKVTITCPVHGDFLQEVGTHLKGAGCKKCSDTQRKPRKKYTTKSFIKKAKEIHGNKYTYEKLVFKGVTEKITVTCKKHGDFQQLAYNHLTGYGCKKCVSSITVSKAEKEIFKFVKNKVKVVQSDREVLDGKELDIYIPSKKLAIEFNGLYFHSDRFKEDNFHLNKTQDCRKKDIQLIHIFEDEWKLKREIVKSRLGNLLGFSNKVYARKCELKEVSTKDKTIFLKNNHIQGAVGSQINIGLYYKEELVSIMTFGKNRKNLGNKEKQGHFELLRFCNKLNITVVGGASRLLKYFENNHAPKQLMSYADVRWSNGNLYESLGFEKIHETGPSFHYTKGDIRENRFKYRKSELIKEGFDKNKTERQIMQERGYFRIYDCGVIKYVKNFN